MSARKISEEDIREMSIIDLEAIVDEVARRLADPAKPAVATLELARRRRLGALTAAEGLWKDRVDVPKDGVQAQEQLRAEWR